MSSKFKKRNTVLIFASDFKCITYSQLQALFNTEEVAEISERKKLIIKDIISESALKQIQRQF